MTHDRRSLFHCPWELIRAVLMRVPPSKGMTFRSNLNIQLPQSAAGTCPIEPKLLVNRVHERRVGSYDTVFLQLTHS